MMKIKQNSKLLVFETFISIRSNWSANEKHVNNHNFIYASNAPNMLVLCLCHESVIAEK